MKNFTEAELLELIRGNLRQIRESRGLSQSDLARLMKVTPSYVCDLERGRRSGLTTATQAKLCDALQIPPEKLFARKKSTR